MVLKTHKMSKKSFYDETMKNWRFQDLNKTFIYSQFLFLKKIKVMERLIH